MDQPLMTETRLVAMLVANAARKCRIGQSEGTKCKGTGGTLLLCSENENTLERT